MPIFRANVAKIIADVFVAKLFKTVLVVWFLMSFVYYKKKKNGKFNIFLNLEGDVSSGQSNFFLFNPIPRGGGGGGVWQICLHIGRFNFWH